MQMAEIPVENATALKFLKLGSFKYKPQGIFWEPGDFMVKDENTAYYLCTDGNDNPSQYSCLENPMDRGAWRATVREVARVRHDLATKPPLPGKKTEGSVR